jgi:hypothetical protein
MENNLRRDKNKAGLPENTNKIETFRSRVKRKNLNTYNPTQQPHIKGIEPII